MDRGANANDSANRAKAPPKSILSKEFVYVSSINTDLRRTFARVRERQERDDAWADFKRELETRAKT